MAARQRAPSCQHEPAVLLSCRSEITLRDRPTTQSLAIPNSIRSRETGLPITCALWAPILFMVRVRVLSASLLTFCAGIVHPVHPGKRLEEPTVLVRPNSEAQLPTRACGGSGTRNVAGRQVVPEYGGRTKEPQAQVPCNDP